MGIACRGVDFVPPAQPHETSARDVLDVVEVGGEEEHCEDEDEDAGWVLAGRSGFEGGREEDRWVTGTY